MLTITDLLNQNSIKFCAIKPLTKSYIAHLFGITIANPIEHNLEPESYFDNFKVTYSSLDISPGYKKNCENKLNKKELSKEDFDHICGGVISPNQFATTIDDELRIESLLKNYFGEGYVAWPLRPWPSNRAKLGYSYYTLEKHAKAFLPEGVCQEHKIGISFKDRFASIDCNVFKCAFYGIPTVYFRSHEGLTDDTDFNNPVLIEKLIEVG